MKGAGVSPETANLTTSFLDMFNPLNFVKPDPLPIVQPLLKLSQTAEKVDMVPSTYNLVKDAAAVIVKSTNETSSSNKNQQDTPPSSQKNQCEE